MKKDRAIIFTLLFSKGTRLGIIYDFKVRPMPLGAKLFVLSQMTLYGNLEYIYGGCDVSDQLGMLSAKVNFN